MLYLKLVLIGFGIVGGIGFIIYLVAAVLEIFTGATGTTTGGTTASILSSMLKGVF
jgi:hypothetical protein